MPSFNIRSTACNEFFAVLIYVARMDRDKLRQIGKRADRVGEDRRIRSVVRDSRPSLLAAYWPHAVIALALLMLAGLMV